MSHTTLHHLLLLLLLQSLALPQRSALNLVSRWSPHSHPRLTCAAAPHVTSLRPTATRVLNLSFTDLRGEVPRGLAACLDLEVLDLSRNSLHGEIPAWIGTLTKLRILNLSSNRLSGPIPPALGRLTKLTTIDFSGNRLSGAVPAALGDCSELRIIVLSRGCGEDNRFEGVIDRSITTLPKLTLLWAPRASLDGRVPEDWGACRRLETVNLGGNRLFGEFPRALFDCPRLRYVNLSSGELDVFDVTGNRLSGSITGSRSSSIAGRRANTASVSLSDHMSSGSAKTGLSTRKLRPCQVTLSSDRHANPGGRSLQSEEEVPSPRSGSRFSSIEIASITSAAGIVSVLLALIIVYVYMRKCTPNARVQALTRKEVVVFVDIGVPLTYESVVRATRNFTASSCIGSGGFGATYKAEVAPGTIVAVKKLFLGKIQGDQQFQAETKTLGRWRHRNLVTLIGFHVSESETFLIYNYLPGGNLENFIGSRHERPADWGVLHNIALDVARALAYLHNDCVPKILHRDVKPSNILLDNDLNAYLSDFGLARLLGNSQTHATTNVEGTFGYVAPEYAMNYRVSDKADVYSYGVVLLELLSDKKALDPSFSPYGDGFNIVSWGAMLIKKGRVNEFFVEGLWGVAPTDDLIGTLRLALQCTVEPHGKRPTMKQVVQQLQKVQPRPPRPA